MVLNQARLPFRHSGSSKQTSLLHVFYEAESMHRFVIPPLENSCADERTRTSKSDGHTVLNRTRLPIPPHLLSNATTHIISNLSLYARIILNKWLTQRHSKNLHLII